jgi:hypothetical protein
MGFQVERQRPLKVYYGSHLVGEYFADLIVDEKVILELKAAATIEQAHITQLQNYLKATETEVGMLLNFGHKPEFKRKVFSTARKSFSQKRPVDPPPSAASASSAFPFDLHKERL